jgi:mono/diheme cytochrome c family protein
LARTAVYLLLSVFVLLSSCSDEKTQNKKAVTWSGDIAKIVYDNCTPCHRPGESGPFNLLSYNDAVKKKNQIAFVTRTGYMPPWPADAGYSHFVGEKVLSKEEIDLIQKWIENDAARGDSTTEPAAPAFYNGSYFGKPDLVIRPQKPVFIKGNGADNFFIMKYPYQIEKDTIVDFVEFVPVQRKLVHHVNGHLLSYDENRKFNYFTGESIHADERSKMQEVYQKMHIPYTDSKEPDFPLLRPNTVYYLPGFIPPSYPKEMGGFKLRKNGVFFLNNIHYGPSNADVTDSSYLNVFFRTDPIKRPVSEAQMGTFGISEIEPEFVIPPNEVKTFHTQKTLPQDISLLSVNPHMHLIGKTFWAFALKSNGDTIPLIRIRKWNFRWQYYYTFKNPVKLVAGTTIHVYGTFDNTVKNPDNPFHPPRSITQGNGVESMKTSEEMFQFIFTYVPYKEGDEFIDLGKTHN